MTFEYRPAEIYIAVNTGAAFPSFIGNETVQVIIDKLQPLFDMSRDLIHEILR